MSELKDFAAGEEAKRLPPTRGLEKRRGDRFND